MPAALRALLPTSLVTLKRQVASAILPARQKQQRCSKRVVQRRAQAGLQADGAYPRRDADEAVPSRMERLGSALMFVLPLSEALFRLHLMLFEYVKRQLQTLLAFAHYQNASLAMEVAEKGRKAAAAMADTVANKQDMVKVLEILYVTARDYIQMALELCNPAAASQAASAAATSAARAASAAAPASSSSSATSAALAASASGGAGSTSSADVMSSVHASWEHWSAGLTSWEAKCLVGLLAFMALLATAAKQQTAAAEQDRQEGLQQRSSTGPFRQPHVLLLSYSCALVLRLSMAPMMSASGVLPEVYQTLSFSCSLVVGSLTTGIFFQLLFGPSGSFKANANKMVVLVRALVLGNRALVTMDWLLSLISNLTFQQKALYALSFGLYMLVLEALLSVVDSTQKNCGR